MNHIRLAGVLCIISSLLSGRAYSLKQEFVPLYQAAHTGDVAWLEELCVDKTLDINKPSPESGMTALHYAARSGKKAAVEFLLGKGAHIDAVANDGSTPLHSAARGGWVAVAYLLMNAGADKSSADQSNRFGLDALNEEGKTLLQTLIQARDIVGLRTALELGANPNAPDIYGRTPLQYAVWQGEEHMVQELLGFGARLNVFDHAGQTPLSDAVFYNNTFIAQMLIDAGAKVNTNNENVMIPLHLAAMYGRREALQLLIDNHVEIDAVDEHGRTALHIAADKADVESVSRLLAGGASITLEDNSGNTALDIAQRNSEQGHDSEGGRVGSSWDAKRRATQRALMYSSTKRVGAISAVFMVAVGLVLGYLSGNKIRALFE